MRIIEQLVYKITGDTTSFDKSVSSSQTSVSKFSKIATTALTALSVGAIANTAKKMFQLAEQAASTLDTIDKMSQKIGISTQAYQEWDFILSQSGASVNGLQASMKTLSNAASEASDGTAQYADEFNRLGVEVTNTDGTLKNTETLFNEVFAALSDMDDQTQRTATAAALLGRSATELAPALNSSSEEIEAMRVQAHDLGLVLGDEAVKAGAALTDSLDQLRRKFTAIKTNAMVPFVNTLNNVIEKILNQKTATEELTRKSEEYKTTLEKLLNPNINLTEAEEARLKILKQIQAQNLAESVYQTQREFTKEKKAVQQANENLVKLKATEKAYALVVNDSNSAIKRYNELKNKDNLTTEEQIEKNEIFNALADTQFQRQTKLLSIGDEINEQKAKANRLNTKYNATLDAITLAVIDGTANIDQYAISNKVFYDSVMDNIKIVKARKEAQENFNNANYETIGALRNVISGIERSTTAENRNAYTTEYLSLAKSRLNELLEEATKSTEGATDATDDNTEATDDNIDALNERFKTQAEAYEELQSYYQTDKEAFISSLQKQADEWLKAGVDRVDVAKWVSDQLDEYNEKNKEANIDALNKRLKAEADAYEELEAYYRTDKEAFIFNIQKQADEWLKAGVDRVKVAKWVSDQLDEFNQKELEGVKNLQIAWEDLANTGITSLVQGFSEIGKALAEGELSWETMAAVSLDALADVLSGLGAQLLALGAVDLFNPLKYFGAPYFAGAAAAYLASGTLSGLAASYDVGTMNVPQDMAAQIHAGEIIIPAGIAEEARTSGISIEPNDSSSNSSNSSVSVVQLVVNQKELGKVVMEAFNAGNCGTLNARIVK